MSQRFCIACGNALLAGAQFCSSCGSAVDSERVGLARTRRFGGGGPRRRWAVLGGLVLAAGVAVFAWAVWSRGETITLDDAMASFEAPEVNTASSTLVAMRSDPAVIRYLSLTGGLLNDLEWASFLPECTAVAAELARGVSAEAFNAFAALEDRDTARLLLDAHAARDRAFASCTVGDQVGFEDERARALLIDEMVERRLRALEQTAA